MKTITIPCRVETCTNVQVLSVDDAVEYQEGSWMCSPCEDALLEQQTAELERADRKYRETRERLVDLLTGSHA